MTIRTHNKLGFMGRKCTENQEYAEAIAERSTENQEYAEAIAGLASLSRTEKPATYKTCECGVHEPLTALVRVVDQQAKAEE
jgi:predicted translin family RNA/ssDNA-binding protein